MPPKQKPKNEEKKQKKSKSQNQALLGQYFPNLNKNKFKAYEKIFVKPNAVFKEEQKLCKEVLTEENEIIKEINCLFRQVFQEAHHQQINSLAQLFHFVEQREKHVDVCLSPVKKTVLHEESQGEASEWTRTVTAKKRKSMDFSDFQFRESKYKEKQNEKTRGQRKYSEIISPNEETLTTMFIEGSKSKFLVSEAKPIDLNELEFGFSMMKIGKSSQRRKKVMDEAKELAQIEEKVSGQPDISLRKEADLKEELPPELQQGGQNRNFYLDNDCQCFSQDAQVLDMSKMSQRLRTGVDKIIELIDRKQKAKQQQINFRNYVQEVKSKNGIKSCLVPQKSHQLQFIRPTQPDSSIQNYQKVCILQKIQPITSNQHNHFDVLNCILHKDGNSHYFCYFQGEQNQNYQFQVSAISFPEVNKFLEPDSTKEQSPESLNTVSSSRFVRYVDSMQPSFNIPECFLEGYIKQAFTANFFREIHQIELQKAQYDAKIYEQII